MKNIKIRYNQHKFAVKNTSFYHFISICMENVNLKQSDLGYKKLESNVRIDRHVSSECYGLSCGPDHSQSGKFLPTKVISIKTKSA